MSKPHEGWEPDCECEACEEEEWVQCYTCPKVILYTESWSPDDCDGPLCDDCDTEITGRDHTLEKLAKIRNEVD